MDVNVGRTDQVVRVSGGMILVALSINAFLNSCVPDIYGPVFGFFGLVFLLTGLTRKCPLNQLADFDTLEDE